MTKNTLMSGVITFLDDHDCARRQYIFILFTIQTSQNIVPNLKAEYKTYKSLH